MKKCLAASVVMLCLLLCGCSLLNGPADPAFSQSVSESTQPLSPTSAPTPTLTPAPTGTPENFSYKVTVAPAVANPLTGLDAAGSDISARPVAIMVNNIKKAMPQYGLKSADIIYEIPAEGGVTRLLAIYQDVTKVDIVGSVRSARPIFIDVAASYDAIYVHHGGSPEAYEMIGDGAVPALDGMRLEGSVFYRDSERRKKLGYEHSSMLTGSKLYEKLQAMKKSGTRMSCRHTDSAFDFVYTDRVPSGESAVTVSVKTGSYTSTYDYMPEYGTYMRTEHGYSSDANGTGKLDFRNVFVLQMKYSVISGDSKGRLDFDNLSSGKGYYFTNGRMESITWKWSSVSSRLRLYGADGKELEVNAGKSFVHFVSSLSQTSAK